MLRKKADRKKRVTVDSLFEKTDRVFRWLMPIVIIGWVIMIVCGLFRGPFSPLCW